MRNITFIIACFFIASTSISLHAQEFRGGEMSFEYIPPTPRFSIVVDLYFKDTAELNQYESIVINYGFIVSDTIQVNEILDMGNDIKLYRYKTEHLFHEYGLIPITIMNEFPINDILNLTQPISFTLQTILNVNNFLLLGNNYYPKFENLQTDYSITNGVFRHQLISSDLQGPVYFQYEANYINSVPFYSLPQATNFRNLDFYTGEFIWDKPVQAGKYLLAFELIEQGVVGRRQRFMIVEIKESDLVTNTQTNDQDQHLLAVTPNPATDLLHLKIGGFHAPVHVRIFDALGREVYHTQVAAASQVETLRIPVTAWPPGMYSVQIQSEGKVLTRQVAVQR